MTRSDAVKTALLVVVAVLAAGCSSPSSIGGLMHNPTSLVLVPACPPDPSVARTYDRTGRDTTPRHPQCEEGSLTREPPGLEVWRYEALVMQRTLEGIPVGRMPGTAWVVGSQDQCEATRRAHTQLDGTPTRKCEGPFWFRPSATQTSGL